MTYDEICEMDSFLGLREEDYCQICGERLIAEEEPYEYAGQSGSRTIIHCPVCE